MFTKWILRNGSASPGKTANTYCDRYNHYYKNGIKNTTEIFELLYAERVSVARQINNNQAHFILLDNNEIRKDINGDFPLFIFVMMFLETNSFRDGVYKYDKLFTASVEIIYETVQKRCPQLIKGDLNALMFSAAHYNSYTYKVIRHLM